MSSRRQFLAASAATVAASALALPRRGRAQAFVAQPAPERDPDGVFLNFNENPAGPAPEAHEAAARALADGGRYRFDIERRLIEAYARFNGIAAEQVTLFPGSSEPLQFAVLAFTSPGRGLVMAEPSYEAPAGTAGLVGTPVRRVALREGDLVHDVDAMAAASAGAGLVYVCNPNNPTGSVTPRADIERLLDAKPADAVLLVDEAYIEYTEEPSLLDLVGSRTDLLVLRTFSKLYGMAGLRCGMACAHPELLARLRPYAGAPMPSPATAAALASLGVPGLVEQRRRVNAAVREETVAWLEARGVACLPSRSNCFMFDAGRPGADIAAALAAQNVFIGRSWPIWPNRVRVTVGTAEEMAVFREAFAQVLANPVAPVARARLPAATGAERYA